MLNNIFEIVDKSLVLYISPITMYISLLLFVGSLLSILARYILHLIGYEVRTQRRNIREKKLKQKNKQSKEESLYLDKFDLALNLNIPQSLHNIPKDRLHGTDLLEKEVLRFGQSAYEININKIPQTPEEERALKERKSKMERKLLTSLSREERDQILNTNSELVDEIELIPYQEFFLLYKGIEMEFKSIMLNRVNILERNYITMKTKIERSGVSKKSSEIYMERYNLLLKELETYEQIISHEGLARKLSDLGNRIRNLANEHPFLVHGYNAYREQQNKPKPINRGGVVRDRRRRRG